MGGCISQGVGYLAVLESQLRRVRVRAGSKQPPALSGFQESKEYSTKQKNNNITAAGRLSGWIEPMTETKETVL